MTIFVGRRSILDEEGGPEHIGRLVAQALRDNESVTVLCPQNVVVLAENPLSSERQALQLPR